MKVAVHILWTPDEKSMERLTSLLHPDVEVTTGENVEPGAEYEILVSGRPKREAMTASSKLHSLVIPFTGIPQITRELMKDFPNVAVHNLHYNAATTAEYAVTLMLAASKLLIPFDRAFRQHIWALPRQSNQSTFLEGKTVVILGYGEIGRRVARACRGLGMKVIAVRRSASEKVPEGADEVHPVGALEKVLPRANVLQIALPQTKETENLIGSRELDLLPEGAILVNVGRGTTVEEEPLYNALKERRLFAAGLDVWYEYPKGPNRGAGKPSPPSKFPFHELDNIVMSPHRAGWSEETELRRFDYLAELVNHAARGEPLPSRVDLVLGY
jgi:phosphoglycerate dehydrogenase-like enzyme